VDGKRETEVGPGLGSPARNRATLGAFACEKLGAPHGVGDRTLQSAPRLLQPTDGSCRSCPWVVGAAE